MTLLSFRSLWHWWRKRGHPSLSRSFLNVVLCPAAAPLAFQSHFFGDLVYIWKRPLASGHSNVIVNSWFVQIISIWFFQSNSVCKSTLNFFQFQIRCGNSFPAKEEMKRRMIIDMTSWEKKGIKKVGAWTERMGFVIALKPFIRKGIVIPTWFSKVGGEIDLLAGSIAPGHLSLV